MRMVFIENNEYSVLLVWFKWRLCMRCRNKLVCEILYYFYVKFVISVIIFDVYELCY